MMMLHQTAASLWQRCWQWLAVCCLCLLCLPIAQAQTELKAIPTLTGPVMDTAQMMSPSAQAALDEQLRQYSKDKGSQIVVLTVDTTAPEDIFSYGMRVARGWQIGREQHDDGVLLLIAKDDKRNQIIVGRGLEGAITDVDAHRILSEVVRPNFQQGNFDAGIVAAVEKLQGLIAGEALPEAQMDVGDDWDLWLVLLFPLLFLTSMVKKIFGRMLGSGISAVLILVACLWFGLGVFMALALAAGTFVFSLLMGDTTNFASGGSGGWSSGGDAYHDSGFGGGGSDFSGGGGDFSGGGASGDW